MHRAVWKDGQAVAVKIQYPGAGKALLNDFTQLARVGRLFGLLMPGLDVKPLLDELRDRVAEELDYHLEAAAQRAFADAYAGDPDIYVPAGRHRDRPRAGDRVDGRHPAVEDHQRRVEDRARPGRHPADQVPVLRARPGPGCCTPTRTRATSGCWPTGGSACSTSARSTGCPDGLPPIFGRLLRIMHDPDPDITEVERELRADNFLRPGIAVDLDALRAFLAPLAEPSSGGDVQVHPGVDARRRRAG